MPVTHESFCSPRPSASASPYTVYIAAAAVVVVIMWLLRLRVQTRVDDVRRWFASRVVSTAICLSVVSNVREAVRYRARRLRVRV